MRYLLFLTIIFYACNVQGQVVHVKAEKGEIEILKNGDYVVKYHNSKSVLKNVRTFIWFNGDPYFETGDFKILKWNKEISDTSFNLQKVWDKLYFIKQHAFGAEWGDTSLYTIDPKQGIRQVMLKKVDNESATSENFSVFLDKYIFFEDSTEGFCLAGTNGKSIACYKWPDVKKNR